MEDNLFLFSQAFGIAIRARGLCALPCKKAENALEDERAKNVRPGPIQDVVYCLANFKQRLEF
jgi:hypothetical protein